MGKCDPNDEKPHTWTTEQLWNESYYFDWFSADGLLGGYIRLGLYPNLGRVWYWATVVGRDRKTILLVDHDIDMPKPDSLEIRAPEFWANHTIIEPLEVFDCALESYGLVIDSPLDAYETELRGKKTPFGLDLRWDTDRAAYMWPPVTPRYEIPCRVSGEAQIGDETIKVDGWGQRDHSWGASRDWWSNTWNWSAGRLEDGTRFHSAGAFFEASDWGVGYKLDGAETDVFADSQDVVVESVLDPSGLATDARIAHNGLDLAVEPIAWAPVLLKHDDGREARFPRCLARYSDVSGRSGYGWAEWNQPQA